jgi:hypothetical protein
VILPKRLADAATSPAPEVNGQHNKQVQVACSNSYIVLSHATVGLVYCLLFFNSCTLVQRISPAITMYTRTLLSLESTLSNVNCLGDSRLLMSSSDMNIARF